MRAEFGGELPLWISRALDGDGVAAGFVAGGEDDVHLERGGHAGLGEGIGGAELARHAGWQGGDDDFVLAAVFRAGDAAEFVAGEGGVVRRGEGDDGLMGGGIVAGGGLHGLGRAVGGRVDDRDGGDERAVRREQALDGGAVAGKQGLHVVLQLVARLAHELEVAGGGVAGGEVAGDRSEQRGELSDAEISGQGEFHAVGIGTLPDVGAIAHGLEENLLGGAWLRHGRQGGDEGRVRRQHAAQAAAEFLGAAEQVALADFHLRAGDFLAVEPVFDAIGGVGQGGTQRGEVGAGLAIARGQPGPSRRIGIDGGPVGEEIIEGRKVGGWS